MERPRLKEALSIPNCMCYFRILLIPLFVWRFATAETAADYYLAGGIVALSGLTDLFDGKIARRFQMVTELGKFLDPLADKLTLGALLLCMALRRPALWPLMALFAVKEGFMAVMGLLLLRRGRKLDGAMWFGKVCTATLYLAAAVLLLFPGLPGGVQNGIALLGAAVMAATLGLYVPVFRRMWRESAR